MIVGITAVGAITVATIATTIAVGTTALGTIAAAMAVGNIAIGTIAAAIVVGTTAASTVAIRACRDIIAAAASRGNGEGGSKGGGGGYRGGNDVNVRGRLVSYTVTYPMAVLATGVADPFESRRCPADPGHVALLPAPFTVGHRAVGRGR